MTRLSFPAAISAVAAVAALAAGTATAAPAVTASTRPLAIGDTITVKGTSVICLALVSSGKSGVGCVLFDSKTEPIRGTYGVGMAVDGTTVITEVTAGGNQKVVLKRKPQARVRRSAREYVAVPGDVYLLPIDANHKLACKITAVKPGQAIRLYQGIKIACWRIVRTGLPVPSSDAIQISDRMAAIVHSDAKGVFGSTVLVKKQPA
jgi:hypothetical protein